MRSDDLVQDYQLEVARQLSDLWINSMFESDRFEDEDVSIHFVLVSEVGSSRESFDERARAVFLNQDGFQTEHFEEFDRQQYNYFQYARAITESQLASIRREGVTEFDSGVLAPNLTDPLEAMLIVRRKTKFAKDQLGKNRTGIIIAGVVGSLLSGLVYFFILKRLIFSPVRKLKRVTERVQQGDLTARSALETGDEFEELSVAFNEMLDRMERDQKQLQKMNESLDLKVEELAEANVGLFESGRLKNEFIASVSHELRTPLNSIIGFAELLESMSVESKEEKEKRTRYLKNILTSGNSLLDMINELLDMAKIEAGRMEVNIESTSITDLLEGLSGIMRPQAKAVGVTLELLMEKELPSLQTDPGKLQQILYNYLSNAIKFAPKNTVVTIAANRITLENGKIGINISVTDHGPGIPEDMMDMVFEKFRQIDATHTREHAGTGLGLAICSELAELIHASLLVNSVVGQGSTFHVQIPEVFASEAQESLMPE
ncbi:MAG: HAMP domain-containing sensor histidine kinase [Planctomycetota bacterium]|nr:HAMP domain-containing sensor histidine kinase [Planctomycetota bacterium]